MKRTLTIIAVIIVILTVTVGLALWMPDWFGNVLFESEEPTWVG